MPASPKFPGALCARFAKMDAPPFLIDPFSMVRFPPKRIVDMRPMSDFPGVVFAIRPANMCAHFFGDGCAHVRFPSRSLCVVSGSRLARFEIWWDFLRAHKVDFPVMEVVVLATAWCAHVATRAGCSCACCDFRGALTCAHSRNPGCHFLHGARFLTCAFSRRRGGVIFWWDFSVCISGCFSGAEMVQKVARKS